MFNTVILFSSSSLTDCNSVDVAAAVVATVPVSVS